MVIGGRESMKGNQWKGALPDASRFVQFNLHGIDRNAKESTRCKESAHTHISAEELACSVIYSVAYPPTLPPSPSCSIYC